MLRITREQTAPSTVTLKLDGRIVGPWVSELEATTEGILAGRSHLTLNLANVEFLDRRAVALIRRLVDRGVGIEGCPGFVAEQLKGV